MMTRLSSQDSLLKTVLLGRSFKGGLAGKVFRRRCFEDSLPKTEMHELILEVDGSFVQGFDEEKEHCVITFREKAVEIFGKQVKFLTITATSAFPQINFYDATNTCDN